MATDAPTTKSSGSIKKKTERRASFAKIESVCDHYNLTLDLKYFEGFKSEECNVEVKGRDVIINCKKPKFDRPDTGFREVHVIYRLPEDIDPDSVTMKRDGLKLKIEATRISYGKPLSLAVCDVTKRRADVQIIGQMA